MAEERNISLSPDDFLESGSSNNQQLNFANPTIANLNVDLSVASGSGSKSIPNKDSPTSISTMRQPIKHMVKTVLLKKTLTMMTTMSEVSLYLYGLPGSGKSQIVRELARRFPFRPKQADSIKWHIQCKDSEHDVKQELKNLTEELQNRGHINKETQQSIIDALNKESTEKLVETLQNCVLPVLLVIEDPYEKSSCQLLGDLLRCLKKPEQNEPTLHLYITSRSKSSILDAHEIEKMKKIGMYKEEIVGGFDEEEAIEYLSEGQSDHREAIVEIFHCFSGLPICLQAVKSFCEKGMINYTDYLDFIKDIQYEINPQKKEEIEKEYGKSAQQVIQTIVLPFISIGKSDATAMLYWKILSCLSYFNYDSIPRTVIEYCCHKLRTVSVQRPDIVDKVDVGSLIDKLVDYLMCTVTVTDEKNEITFHEVVTTSFRLPVNQTSFLEPSFHPLKMAIEIMSGLVTKDMKKKEHCQKMFKLRRHLQSLLKHVEKDQLNLFQGEDSIMLKALTSHLYETAAAIMLNESPALFFEESDKHFRKALSYIWEGEDLTKVKDKPDEIAKNIVEKLASKAENLPKDFAVKYASKLDISMDKWEIDFFREKTRSKICFEEIPQLFKSKACKEEIIRKLQECQLFLADEKYRQIFYLERVASILHNWSRHVLYMESEQAQSDKRGMWLTQLSNSIAVQCKNEFGVTLLIERFSQTGGQIPIVLKQKKNVDDNLKALYFCKEILSENVDPSDMYENGMLKEVHGPLHTSARLTLLRHIVRINARLIDKTDLEESDSDCDQLFDLAIENVNEIANSIMCIIYCAKYHAAKGDYGKSMECFETYFKVTESGGHLKPRYNVKCWAAYNYARAVCSPCCQPTPEAVTDSLSRCKQVLGNSEIVSKDLQSLLKESVKQLEKMKFDK